MNQFYMQQIQAGAILSGHGSYKHWRTAYFFACAVLCGDFCFVFFPACWDTRGMKRPAAADPVSPREPVPAAKKQGGPHTFLSRGDSRIFDGSMEVALGKSSSWRDDQPSAEAWRLRLLAYLACTNCPTCLLTYLPPRKRTISCGKVVAAQT